MSQYADYIQHGWAICALEKGKKGPTYPGWQRKGIPLDAADGLDGAGLLHSLSGTCCIDIDNLEKATPWLAERGVDIARLMSMPSAVMITSGTINRAKLLFRLPTPLRTLQPANSGIELRCMSGAGTSVHDALPPSTHPSGRTYEWRYGEPMIGDWRELPPLPSTVLSLWRSLDAETKEPAHIQSLGLQQASPRNISAILEALQAVVATRDPNMDYPGWVKIGMQLNHEGHGSQEAFDIWANWSRGISRKPYPGDGVLRTHWASFSSGAGKAVVTGKGLIGERPAEADEFPDEPMTAPGAAPPADSTAAGMGETKKQIKESARTKLEARLVYVESSERYFDLLKHRIIGSDNALGHIFTGMMPNGKMGKLDPVEMLRQSNTKRIIDQLGFHPGEGATYEDQGRTYANQYISRLPEPIEPTVEDRARVEWVFNRIDDPVFRCWLKEYYAHVVQRPGVKIRSAPLIWSKTQRNGKSTLMGAIPALLVGPEYSKEVTCNTLESDFNDYMREAWHVNLIEFRAGLKMERNKISQKLKAMIAETRIELHPKGSAAYTMPNLCFVTGSSNDGDAAHVDNADARWGVHEMRQPHYTPAEVQYVYHEFLNLPHAAAVLRGYFSAIPLFTFDPNDEAPMTADKAAMMVAGQSVDEEFLHTALEQQDGPFGKDVALCSEVLQFVHKHCSTRPSGKRISSVLADHGIRAFQFRYGARIFTAYLLRNDEKWRHMNGKDLFAYVNDEVLDTAK